MLYLRCGQCLSRRHGGWIELAHHHNFSRPQLLTLLGEAGFEPVSYGIPFRYKALMEIYMRRVAMPTVAVENVAYAMS